MFLKEITFQSLLGRISFVSQRSDTDFFFLFFFALSSEFTKKREFKHGYPRWKFVSKPIVL